MTTSRLEAFSDAVIAIIITIMVLELRPPHDTTWEALRPLLPIFLTYVLSFVFLGIYWNNHHHLLQVSQVVSGKILWANLHLLFWLSLTPFVTGWMGENDFAAVPTAVYGLVLLLAAIAYYRISPVCYAVAIPLAFVNRWIALGLYVFVALIWLVPDRRIESIIESPTA